MKHSIIPLLAGLIGLTSGCVTTIPQNREIAFTYAVEKLDQNQPGPSAAAAWLYLKGSSKEDPRYDRAQRLLARASHDLGLTYAAAQWYLDIAQGRREPELLPESIRGLKMIVDSGVFDEDAIVDGYLGTADIEGLPDDLQAFVSYHQGLHDLRLRKPAWSEGHFTKIPSTSPFGAKAAYVRAVERVAANDLNSAIKRFEALEESPGTPKTLLSDVRRSLARINATQGDFDKSLERYEMLRQEAPDDPELLLEMAWLHYDNGDVRRTLGLLLALDAPIYSELIAPERFLLEALALRRLCQFGPARRAATRLRAEYGDALQDLYSGVPLMSSKALRAAARQRRSTRTMSALYDRIKLEREMLDGLGLGESLTKHLGTVYRIGEREARRKLEAKLTREVDDLAEELLAAEEGVNLILHELGVGLLRGRKPSPGKPIPPPLVISTRDRRSVFAFEGEFWTDELDDLVVLAEDRCTE